MAGLGADQRVDAATEGGRGPAHPAGVRDGGAAAARECGRRPPHPRLPAGRVGARVHVSRSGGAKGAKQFENIASVEEVVTKARPVDLRLTWEKRLVPDLLGQLVEVSGKATKAAAESDRPKALGRLLTEGERRELRSGGARAGGVQRRPRVRRRVAPLRADGAARRRRWEGGAVVVAHILLRQEAGGAVAAVGRGGGGGGGGSATKSPPSPSGAARSLVRVGRTRRRGAAAPHQPRGAAGARDEAARGGDERRGGREKSRTWGRGTRGGLCSK